MREKQPASDSDVRVTIALMRFFGFTTLVGGGAVAGSCFANLHDWCYAVLGGLLGFWIWMKS